MQELQQTVCLISQRLYHNELMNKVDHHSNTNKTPITLVAHFLSSCIVAFDP